MTRSLQLAVEVVEGTHIQQGTLDQTAVLAAVEGRGMYRVKLP
ncbi:MAG: hypothetical protein U1E51_07655 [Candidatus Binatia bacterium]|nr:hypothetical protein [Candidatus Binatia bacterium]